ncbi:MAG: hypothetical protein ACI80S_001281, partial [Pseudohongiellaceae bacterium]
APRASKPKDAPTKNNAVKYIDLEISLMTES